MNNEGKTFTFGIPVYNGMEYLPQTIDSVMAQTRKDFNVLIINDGSTDETVEYLNSVRDPRFKVFHQSNHGLTNTLNRMLSMCQTPWLVRLDADDLARPERIEILANHVERYPNAGMFYSDAAHFGFASRASQARITRGTPAELLGFVRQGRLLSLIHSSVALNVAKVREIGGYRFDLHVEDIDLWWRMALEHDIYHIPELTIDYRLNTSSVCRNNLRDLTLNTLYIQYLLLSHLFRLPAHTYAEAVPVLQEFLDERWLHYRDCMWNSAIEETNGHHVRAMQLALTAFAFSPTRFFDRALHSVMPGRAYTVGVDPKLFWTKRRELWSFPIRTARTLEPALQ